jgi:hypothetical protein
MKDRNAGKHGDLLLFREKVKAQSSDDDRVELYNATKLEQEASAKRTAIEELKSLDAALTDDPEWQLDNAEEQLRSADNVKVIVSPCEGVGFTVEYVIEDEEEEEAKPSATTSNDYVIVIKLNGEHIAESPMRVTATKPFVWSAPMPDGDASRLAAGKRKGGRKAGNKPATSSTRALASFSFMSLADGSPSTPPASPTPAASSFAFSPATPADDAGSSLEATRLDSSSPFGSVSAPTSAFASASSPFSPSSSSPWAPTSSFPASPFTFSASSPSSTAATTTSTPVATTSTPSPSSSPFFFAFGQDK